MVLHGLDEVGVTEYLVPGTHFSELNRESSLDCPERIEIVQELGLLLPGIQALQQVICEEQVLGNLVNRRRCQLNGRLGLIVVCLSLEASFEDAEERLLILSEECVSVIRVEVQEVGLDTSILNFVVMDLRNALHDQVDVLDILHVEDLEHVSQALVDPVLIAEQY